jgi:hypothetical protein
MNATVAMPVWSLLVVIALLVVWEALTTWQTRLLRDLFRLYWRERYDEDLPE